MMTYVALAIPIPLSDTPFETEDEMAKTAAEDQDTYYGGKNAW